jgi:hypothetical protein
MNKLYCSNVGCAKPNYYESTKPKFCSHCGQSFSSGFATAAIAPVQPVVYVPATRPPQKKIIVVEEPEENELDFSNFKINIIDSPRKLTLGQIQSNAGYVPNSDRPVGNQLDADAVLKDNMRRARQVNRDTEGE